MEQEIPLSGGRTTQRVVRIGSFVHRPQNANADFTHRVLRHLEEKGIFFVPHFHGIDPNGREILTFLEGDVPNDLGQFSTEQCVHAAKLIRSLHDALSNFPGCPPGQTVCHFDLSPCNFVFQDGIPRGVIDWDACGFGDPMDDLAYAVWMWLDIGDDEKDPVSLRERIHAMLDAYGATHRRSFAARILEQMRRVGATTFPSPEQTLATHGWAEDCIRWMCAHPDACPNED